jgi:tRNA threonylcarbamoyl adenosine modification protein YjeE
VTRLDFADIKDFAQEIANQLRKEAHFCLWLSGDLGAGKTTTTGFILRALGLPQHIPVTSPTFTYFNEYKINDKYYGHMDLYRAESEFSLEEIGVADLAHFHGHFVEWPNQIPPHPILEPTHLLSLKLTDIETRREVNFETVPKP